MSHPSSTCAWSVATTHCLRSVAHLTEHPPLVVQPCDGPPEGALQEGSEGEWHDRDGRGTHLQLPPLGNRRHRWISSLTFLRGCLFNKGGGGGTMGHLRESSYEFEIEFYPILTLR